MSQHIWLSGLPQDFVSHVENWLNTTPQLPVATAALLDSLHERHAPFLPPIVVYLMNQPPEDVEHMRVPLFHICAAWLQAWEQQGSPESLDDFLLAGQWSLDSTMAYSLTIGLVLDRALLKEETPRLISKFTCMLLQHRYKQHLGWYNLQGYPEPLFRILLERAEIHTPLHVPTPYYPIVNFLAKQTGKPWSVILFCTAITLLGELKRNGNPRRGMLTNLLYLRRVKSILQVFYYNQGLNVEDRHAASTLAAFIEGKLTTLREMKRSTRASMTQTYLNCVASQERYIEQFPEHSQQLRPHLLPRPTRAVTGLALSDILAEQKQRRQADVTAAHPEFFQWLRLAEVRRNVARAISATFHAMHESCTPFDVPLPDQSAILKFRVVPISEIRQHTSRSISDRTRLVEYLGYEGPPNTRNQQPFFVALHRAYFDDQFLKKLMKLGYCRSDFRSYDCGIIRPGEGHRVFCRKMMKLDLSAEVVPRTYLEVDMFAYAMSVACLQIELMLSTAIRAHELQQPRVDIDFVYPNSSIPALYIDTEDEIEKWIYIMLYPKGHKPAQGHPPIQYKFPAYIQDSWSIVREHHHLIWGPEQDVALENGAAYGIEPGPFLFQAFGKIIRMNAERMLPPNILIGHQAIREDELVASSKPHVFRVLSINESMASGVSLKEISSNVHDGNLQMTRHYLSDLLPEHYNMEDVSYWDALCVDLLD